MSQAKPGQILIAEAEALQEEHAFAEADYRLVGLPNTRYQQLPEGGAQ